MRTYIYRNKETNKPYTYGEMLKALTNEYNNEADWSKYFYRHYYSI